MSAARPADTRRPANLRAAVARRLRRGARAAGAAFSLVELMVVMGVIVILVGGIALALSGRGSDGAALAQAQSIVASLVGATRAQAALHQTNAKLIVYARQPATGVADNTRYLRVLQVLRQETLANGTTTVWVAAGDPVTLPVPVCVVPPSVPATHLNTGVAWNNNAATGPVSTLRQENISYRGQSGATTLQYFGAVGAAGVVYSLDFAADGTVTSNTSGNPTKIALATATLSQTTFPRFNNASTARGLFVRKTGAISLVDEATGF